jgi:TonB family protein
VNQAAANPTNRWTGATGSDFRIKRDPAKLLGNAVARSTLPFGICSRERKHMTLTKIILIVSSISLLGLATLAQSNDNASPSVVAAVTPIYPPIARSANATGDISLDVEINREGKVTSVDAKSGHPLLRRVSEDAARHWLFTPAPDGDKKRRAHLTFSFRILPEKTPYYDGTPVFFPPYKIEVRTIAPSLVGP